MSGAWQPSAWKVGAWKIGAWVSGGAPPSEGGRVDALLAVLYALTAALTTATVSPDLQITSGLLLPSATTGRVESSVVVVGRIERT
jgi:hypothetical protein